MSSAVHPRFIALSGGVGGAKLAHGLALTLAADELMIVVNTGDDFQHLGLTICPDLDSVSYALAGLSDPVRGWGRAHESFVMLQTLRSLGGPDWFQLGDRDLALHLERRRLLDEGLSLSAVTSRLSEKLGIGHAIVPMSDDPVRTILDTPGGTLDFQSYFVAQRCEPVIKAVRFAGAESARLAPALIDALASPGLEAIILCPSNPILSLDPILAVPGLRQALRDSRVPVIGISPLIGGQAVKGPTAKIMRELGLAANATGCAGHYADFLDGYVIDEADAALEDEVARIVPHVTVAQTLMRSDMDRAALAREAIAFARRAAPVGGLS